jgi:ribosomal protein S12 methylthiotransferase
MDLLPQRLGAPGSGAERGTARKLFTPAHIAYLKIAEGCSNSCTYCTIPHIRGGLSSRSRESLIAEASLLASEGVRELIVVAQDTGAWGFDSGQEGGLHDLLEELADVMEPGWIRLMYLHPLHVDIPGIIDLCRRGRVCRYLDIPIQHASDAVLERMGRGYGKEDLVRLISALRSEIEGLVLRTTVMVGFPGETEDDFQELARFIEDISFDHVGAFAYSDEAPTPAARLGGKVNRDEAEQRRNAILDIQMDVSGQRLSERVGALETILVDEVLKEGERPAPSTWGVGRYYGQAYEVDGVTFLTGKRCEPGEFTTARIEGCTAYDLVARAGNFN